MMQVVHGKLRPGDGGVIAVDAQYNIVMSFNTLGMYRAFADSSGSRGAMIFNDPKI